MNAVIEGKKAAAVSAERRSRYLVRGLVVFIVGVVLVVNDNIVELHGPGRDA